MPKFYVEEIPSFALKFSFQSNMAFMLAVFILMLALGWALRDHRRRLLELASEEQEDRLYLGILGILFTVASMGSYYAFNQTSVDTSGRITVLNPMVTEVVRIIRALLQTLDKSHDTWPPYTSDMPVRVPVPTVRGLSEHGGHPQRSLQSMDGIYNFVSLCVLLMVTLFATWYFFPQRRHNFSPPRPYMGFFDEASETESSKSISQRRRKSSQARTERKATSTEGD